MTNTTKPLRPAHLFLAAAVIVAMVCGCGPTTADPETDQSVGAVDQALCVKTTTDVCSRWFRCSPNRALTFWHTEDKCKMGVDAFCSKWKTWSKGSCKANNDVIKECSGKMAAGDCTTVPACQTLAECYNVVK
mgnify:CR=1 FL=1